MAKPHSNPSAPNSGVGIPTGRSGEHATFPSVPDQVLPGAYPPPTGSADFLSGHRRIGTASPVRTPTPAHQGKGSLPAGRMCSSRVFRCHRAYAPSEWVALVCGKTSYVSTPVSAVYIPPASSRRSPPRTRSSR